MQQFPSLKANSIPISQEISNFVSPKSSSMYFYSSLPFTVLRQIEAFTSYSLISTLTLSMAQTHARFTPSPCQITCPLSISFIVPQDQSQSDFCEIFCNAVSCYVVQLLAPRPTNKLQLTTCLFSTLTATFLTWTPSPP